MRLPFYGWRVDHEMKIVDWSTEAFGVVWMRENVQSISFPIYQSRDGEDHYYTGQSWIMPPRPKCMPIRNCRDDQFPIIHNNGVFLVGFRKKWIPIS